MGHSVAWVGLRLSDPRGLYDAFGVVPSGTTDDPASQPLVAARIPGGWTIVLVNLAAGGDERLFDGVFLARLSKLAPAVFFVSDTDSRDSGVAQWRGGECQWSLVHDPDDDDGPLLGAGELPEPLDTLRVAADPFVVPAKIALSLTVFRHDQHDQPGIAYEVLRYAPRPGGLAPTASCPSPSAFVPSVYDLGGDVRQWHDQAPLLAMLQKVAAEEEDFLILRGDNRWFMQCAGNEQGAVMVEWQRQSEGKPQHFRLARHPGPFEGEPPVAFAPEEAHAHFLSFAKLGVPAPGAFLLDVTDEIFG